MLQLAAIEEERHDAKAIFALFQITQILFDNLAYTRVSKNFKDVFCNVHLNDNSSLCQFK